MTLGRPGALLADRYRLDRLVEGNESSERWQAYDVRLARPVTARLTPAASDAASEEAAQAALERLARLNHPGVAAVYDVGTADDLGGSGSADGDGNRGDGGGDAGVGGVIYAISEWINGRTLAQIMETGSQPWPRIADWGRQIGGALAALHSLGIVHGALGPNGIAIHDDRQVKILDAGLGSLAGDEAPADGDEVGDAEADEGEVGEAASAGRGAGEVGARGEAAGEFEDPSADEPFEPGSEGHVGVPAGAAEDVYALGGLLWEAGVGTAPVLVEREVAEGEVAGDEVARGGSGGVDMRPLLEAGAPVELAELLAEMLDGDPARRPTAAVAQQRFGPFAPTERISDTLPEIPIAAAWTQTLASSRALAAAPTPQVGRTQVTGLAQRGGAADAAAARLAAERERRRRRGLFLGLALLLAAIGAGVGLLVANLNPSNGAIPSGGNTGVPSTGPVGTVTLPSASASPSPSLTSTSATPVVSHKPSSSPSPSPSPSPSASPSPSSASPSPSDPSPSASAPSTTASSSAGATSSPASDPSSSAKPQPGL